jgi:G3E family GTPase
MKKSIVLVTGVHPEPMATTVLSLQWDMPNAVVVRHHIDVARSVLERVVSDITGVVEREEIDLAHACVNCAIREDVVPTIRRLAEDDRWASVISHLPVSAEADQVCHVLGKDRRLSRTVQVSTVIAALEGPSLEDDLIGDDLLCERDLGIAEDDRRGVGEVTSDLVEFADLVVVGDQPHRAGWDLARTLARPSAGVLAGTEMLTPDVLASARHSLAQTLEWTDPLRTADIPPSSTKHAWRIDLRSPQPFHPERLLDSMEQLGAGRHRSRGCFWLPSRPGVAVVWKGAGGQVSIGEADGGWGRTTPHTRVTITGSNTAPTHLHEAFSAMLLRPDEVYRGVEDGFEDWLGPIRDVA